MWYCRECGKQNEDYANFCTGCGARNDAVPKPAGEAENEKSRSKLLPIVIAVAAVCALAIACLFIFNVHSHKWEKATCEYPAYCSVCGKTQGEALGHDWQDADCTSAKTCITCGKTVGQPLGHDWQDATESAPMTCRRCGATQGEPLKPAAAVPAAEPAPEAAQADAAPAASFAPQVGDIVEFGSYEQNNKTADGKEPISWIVLDISGGKALLLSEYALDVRQYNNVYDSVTWETCDLREWLNNDFYSAAFSAEERKCIVTVTNEVDRHKTGNPTDDNVFVLSSAEITSYLPSKDLRLVKATPYANGRGAYNNGYYNSTWYWLRTPGTNCHHVAAVDSYGAVAADTSVSMSGGCIRPAIWVTVG